LKKTKNKPTFIRKKIKTKVETSGLEKSIVTNLGPYFKSELKLSLEEVEVE